MATKHVTIDASVIVSICALEPQKYEVADSALQDYAQNQFECHAPAVVVAEVFHALCRKLKVDHSLNSVQYRSAILDFESMMAVIQLHPQGDVPMITRASALLGARGCQLSNDAIYLALTEHLKTSGDAEIVTFDAGIREHAAALAPGITVNLLVPKVTPG